MAIISIKITVVITKEENCYTARCLEYDLTSRGITSEEALDNMQEILLVCCENETCEVDVRQNYTTTMATAV